MTARLPVLIFVLLVVLAGCGDDYAAGDDDDGADVPPVGDDDDDDSDDDDVSPPPADDDDDNDTSPPGPNLRWVNCSEFFPIEMFFLLPPGTRCGEVGAPIDWNDPDGGRLAVRFAHLFSESYEPAGTVAINLGGPAPNLRNLTLITARPTALAPAGLRENFDLLFVETRGSSMSSTPLVCPWFLADRPLVNYDHYRRLVGECLDAIPHGVSPALMSTADAARDLEEVRKALEIDQLRLFGNSYGTRLMLEYLRLFEDRVAAYVLDSTLPPQGDGKHYLDEVLDELAAACAEDPMCPFVNAAELRAATAEVLAGREPGPKTKPHDLALDLFHLGDRPTQLAQWPVALAAGLDGDWEWVDSWHASVWLLRGEAVELMHDGLLFEFDPYSDNTMCIDFPGWNDFAGREFVLDDLTPPYAPLDQIETMTHINCEELAARYDRAPSVDPAAVVSDVPGLLIAPRFDQATPAQWAYRAVDEGLSGAYVTPVNADHAVLIDLGTLTIGMPLAQQDCLRALTPAFLAEPFDPAELPCVTELTAPLQFDANR
jgi:pimeloyl-ACP methyl ester carboxylesterase